MFFCTKELGVVKTNCKEHKLYIITLPASQMLDHTIYSNKVFLLLPNLLTQMPFAP